MIQIAKINVKNDKKSRGRCSMCYFWGSEIIKNTFLKLFKPSPVVDSCSTTTTLLLLHTVRSQTKIRFCDLRGPCNNSSSSSHDDSWRRLCERDVATLPGVGVRSDFACHITSSRTVSCFSLLGQLFFSAFVQRYYYDIHLEAPTSFLFCFRRTALQMADPGRLEQDYEAAYEIVTDPGPQNTFWVFF